MKQAMSNDEVFQALDNGLRATLAERAIAQNWRSVPWQHEPWWITLCGMSEIQLHAAHMSLERDGMIAYYPTIDKAQRDVATRIKPGRYLQRVAPDLSNEELAKWASAVKIANSDMLGLTLSYATTAGEMRRVYEEGPHSCMAGSANDYYCDCLHPAELYAAGDLHVAYAEYEGAVIARTLVWPERKLCNRLYVKRAAEFPDDLISAGVTQRAVLSAFRALLKADGYNAENCTLEHGEDFEGARLCAVLVSPSDENISDNNGNPNECVWACPYIDGARRVDYDGKHLIISKGGEFDASRQDGQVNCERCTCCSECGCVGVLDGDGLCEECANNYVFCEACGDRVDTNDAYYHSREHYCESCFNDRFTVCNHCDEFFQRSEVNDYNTDRGEMSLCSECANEVTATCESCDATLPCSKAREHRGKLLCEECYVKSVYDHDHGLVFPHEGTEEDQLVIGDDLNVRGARGSSCQCDTCIYCRAKKRGYESGIPQPAFHDSDEVHITTLTGHVLDTLVCQMTISATQAATQLQGSV